jgi:hypothetical protein
LGAKFTQKFVMLTVLEKTAHLYIAPNIIEWSHHGGWNGAGPEAQRVLAGKAKESTVKS